MDTYANFMELAANERYLKDYIIEHQIIESKILVFTPHGGGIEPGATELVKAIAGDDINYYTLTAKKASGNDKLHITSSHFDEPKLLQILTTIDKSIAIHGCKDTTDIIYIGGRDELLKSRIKGFLDNAGFNTSEGVKFIAEGLDTITNKNKTQEGVQLEISKGYRNKMFDDISSAAGRIIKKELFWKFVVGIRSALEPFIFGLDDTSNIILS